MRIFFVRHGEPDYERDCLTDRGRLQAQAAARRLAGEGIEEIYSSPNGRARETAACTAALLGLPVQILDYMHEITWGGPEIPENGHPWTLSERMVNEQGFDCGAQDWRAHPFFRENAATACYDRISALFDEWMAAHGYRREGIRYLCEAERQRQIAVFSHGGSGGCVLAHLLALPMPYVMTYLPYEFTSVTVLEFPVQPGAHVHPRLELFNDVAHTRSMGSGLILQQNPDT